MTRSRYAFPAYVDGVRKPEGIATIRSSHQPPPPDLQAKHWRTDGPTFLSPGAVVAQVSAEHRSVIRPRPPP
jgi:hypothetical protein